MTTDRSEATADAKSSEVLPVPAPFCDECGRTVQVSCLLAEPRSQESVEAIQAIILAAHQRFHW